MRKMKLLTLVITAMLLFTYSNVFASAGDKNNAGSDGQYTITESYSYPVALGTDKWRALKTHVEKMAVCKIPEGILQKMTAKALVETVLKYPLLVDMFAWDTPESGYQAVYEQFNGLQELACRPDALDELNNWNNALLAEGSSTSLDSMYINIIKSGISSTQAPSVKTTSVVAPLYTSTYVYTPKGSAVPALKDYTWADQGITYDQAVQQFNSLLAAYPYAVKVADPNPSYNCHSYAWYYQSTSNTYWINDPSRYMSDGSYQSSTAAASGRRIYYNNGSLSNNHSGYVFSVYSGYVGVRSKWGALGLVEHDKGDCPYAGASTSYTYWY